MGNVKHKIKIDLVRRSVPPVIDAVQGDTGTRIVEISLFENYVPWEIPDNTKFLINYRRKDGSGGDYDTLPNNNLAYSFYGNIVSVELVSPILSKSGIVDVQLQMNMDNDILSTFSFTINVEESTFVDKPITEEDYSNIKTFIKTEIKSELDAAKSSGEFDGEDGFSPEIKITRFDNGDTGGVEISVENKETVYSASVLDGKDGHTPIKGVDYFTPEDTQPFIDLVESVKHFCINFTKNPDGSYSADATRVQAYEAQTAGKLVFCTVPVGNSSALQIPLKRNFFGMLLFEGVVDKNIVRVKYEYNDGVTPTVDNIITVEIEELSGENSGGNADQSGLSTTASELLITILRNGVYSADQSANITALAAELAVTEEEEPDTPVEPDQPVTPEKTLSSISATYSGGDVAVGTAVADLTGIVVTAHYSDGTSEAVTGYTLSGEIAEGSNTITVTYEGKTATFTVTGVAESGGEDEPDNEEVILPEGVTQVAYLQSDGASYINTEYCLKEGEFWEFGCDLSGDIAGWNPAVHAFDGNCQVYNSFMGVLMRYVRGGPGVTTYAVNSGTRIDLSAQENVAIKCAPLPSSTYTSCTIYNSAGERITFGTSYGTSHMPDMTQPLYLFAGNNNGTAQNYINGLKIRWFKIVDSNGNTLRNYLPITDTSGVACMYETTQGAYHYNQGTGSFTIGEVE